MGTTGFSCTRSHATAGVCLIVLLLVASCKRVLAGGAVVSCAGDCTAGGAVTISDTIVLVNVALGDADPSLCPSGIPPGRAVDVTLIIEAIGNSLGECKPGPTPTPAATVVPTATPMAGPSAAGTWTEGPLSVTSSTCNGATAAIVQQAAAAAPPSCDHHVSQVGPVVHGVDCQGNSADGTIDGKGVVLFVQPPQSETFANGCMFTLSDTIAIDTSRSPTTATYTLKLAFSGPCSPFASCTAYLHSQWTKD